MEEMKINLDVKEQNSVIKDFISILMEIENTKGTKEKKRILSNCMAGKNGNHMKVLFKTAIDPYVKLNVSRDTIENMKTKAIEYYENNKDDLTQQTNDLGILQHFCQLTYYLDARLLSGHNAVNAIMHFLAKGTTVDTNFAEWFGRVLTKDLRIGINEKGICETLDIKVRNFELQAAEDTQHLEKNVKELFDNPSNYCVEIKFDGFRMIARFENNDVRFFTRNGREKKGFVNIKNELMKQYNKLEGFVLDGEAISKGNWNDTASAIQSSVNFDEEKDKSIVYNVFDILSIREFDDAVCSNVLEDRRKLLYTIIQQNDTIKITEAFQLPNTPELAISFMHEKFRELRVSGFEGLMIKDLKSTYNYKRDRSWLKYKGENTGDFLCVGILEGKGKLKGTLGKIRVQINDNLYCDVSGFTDEERDYYWKNSDTIVGHVVEIKYTERTKTDSLRNPRFVCVRDDKDFDQVD